MGAKSSRNTSQNNNSDGHLLGYFRNTFIRGGGGTNTNPPSYTVSPSSSTVNEGSSVTFTVNTVAVLPGTTLYWTTNVVSGTVNASDFSDSATSGSFTVTGSFGSGTASITRTLSNDLTTEGSESFQIQIRTGSTSGTIVATSSTVTINDTSVETYSVSPNISSVNEGSSVTFTVTTGGVPNGTTLYWTTNTVSGTINASDFSDSATSGSFIISTNSGSITRTLTNDVLTEGSESFQIQIRTGSTSGTVVATSSTVTINDTSTTFSATGGSESTVSRPGFKVHTFTGPGSFVTSGGPVSGVNVEYLVIAGGGGGGGQAPFGSGGGGGGGAGGYRTGTLTVTPGTYPITVGGGGSPGPAGSAGGAGNPSTFSTITSTGGGGGAPASEDTVVRAGSGGSGGGGGRGPAGGRNPGASGTVGQGNPGGGGYHNPGVSSAGGGGGGAGGTGNDAPTAGNPSPGGVGGSSASSSITGSSVARAGGGGGGKDHPAGGGPGGGGGAAAGGSNGGGGSATANTGGGAGGAGTGAGGGGGSGIVIIAYPTA